jgi:hypothetical protein
VANITTFACYSMLDEDAIESGALLAVYGVSKSFRTGRLERELQMVQLYAISCSCIAVL